MTTPAQPPGVTEVRPPIVVGSPDRLGPGNRITISFTGLTITPAPHVIRIREDGFISLPLITDRVKAAGKTVSDLEQELEEMYEPDIYRDVTITIRTEDRFFFVGGEVRNQSRQLYLGNITVMQAIQSAGGFTDFADRHKVRVIRSNGSVEIVDCTEALKQPALDLGVHPGDQIVIDKRFF